MEVSSIVPSPSTRETEEACFQQMATPVEAEGDPRRIRIVENAIYQLGELYAEKKLVSNMQMLFHATQSVFSRVPKSKAGKILRKLFDYASLSGMSLSEQQEICKKLISWSREQKLSFLRYQLQIRLASLYFENAEYRLSLSVLLVLLREIRKLDDKPVLVEVYLLMSRVYYFIQNFSKSKGTLVTARTHANSIYCPPLLQAELDLQSGVLHMQEKDPNSAYSYLYEAFEGFHTGGAEHRLKALRALTYMLLCKGFTDEGRELVSVLQSKNVQKYDTQIIQAVKELSETYKAHDTLGFKLCLERYSEILKIDPIVNSFVKDQYDSLLELHLTKIAKPYSVVQLSYMASLVQLPVSEVEAKLSQMILDRRLSAILDQQQQSLIMDEPSTDCEQAEQALAVVENLAKVLDALEQDVCRTEEVKGVPSNDKP